MRAHLFYTVFLTGLFLTPFANAADGTINFTGKILDAACTVDSADASQTVNLGSINKASFTSSGTTAGAAAFNITVSNCDPAITRIAARFDGSQSSDDPRVLALSTGGAVGVGIAFYEQDSTTMIPLATKSVGIAKPAASGASADLNFVAKYIATKAPTSIIGGDGNAAATFTMDYN